MTIICIIYELRHAHIHIYIYIKLTGMYNYELGQSKTDKASSSRSSSTTANLDLKIGITDHDTIRVHIFMQALTVWESDTISPTYPRKLKITIFWRHFWPKICMTAKKMLVPNQGENCGRQSWKHKRRGSISVAVPNSSPVKRCDHKSIPIYYTSSDRTSSMTAMPRSSFASFDLEN